MSHSILISILLTFVGLADYFRHVFRQFHIIKIIFTKIIFLSRIV